MMTRSFSTPRIATFLLAAFAALAASAPAPPMMASTDGLVNGDRLRIAAGERASAPPGGHQGVAAETERAVPAGRSCAASTYSRHLRAVIVVGGARACGRDILRDASLWAWDGMAWRVAAQLPPQISAREDQLLASDDRDGFVLVYGGRRNGMVSNDLWIWQRGEWREADGKVRPPLTEHGAAAFDQARRKLVVFGGATRAGARGETWEWDSAAGWTETRTGEVPPPRLGHSLAWSPLHKGVILYGGFNDGGQLRDTWLWNGSSWRQLDSRGPADTEGPALAGADAAVYMFAPAGVERSGPLHVWRLGNGTWTKVPSTIGPPVTIGPTLAYDAERRVAVLFGGFDQARQAPSAAVWEFDGRRWVSR